MDSWNDVVGNLYQSILGYQNDKVGVLTQWLSDIRRSDIPEDVCCIEDTEFRVRKAISELGL
jgi:hypothetical protein